MSSVGAHWPRLCSANARLFRTTLGSCATRFSAATPAKPGSAACRHARARIVAERALRSAGERNSNQADTDKTQRGHPPATAPQHSQYEKLRLTSPYAAERSTPSTLSDVSGSYS